jgi:cephalosporin hydroxylase
MVDFTSMSVSYHAIDGNPVDVADCYLMDKAIEDKAKYALFIEEDVVVPWHGAVQLIETSQQYPDAIIVGVYYVKFSGVMLSQRDEENRWSCIDATPNTGLRRNIAGCGLGCALIPLSVIYKIKQNFPDIPLFCIVPEKCWGDEEVKGIGQDTWFYHLVKECGIEVICDTRVQCLHIELATGKYTAHPDVNLDDYVTSIPITEPLTLKDRERVSRDYIDRMQLPGYINGIDASLDGLVVDYSDETRDKVLACLNDKSRTCTQNFYEVARLCERIKAVQPKTILEIGVDRGGTMNLFLAFSHPDARYIGIDNAPRIAPDKHEFINADSRSPQTIEKVKKLLNGSKVDFLFLDGGHEEDTVRSDFAIYSPLVQEGGLIALHDIAVNVVGNNSYAEHCAGIKKFWSELKGKYDTEEFINTNAEMQFGIGLIKVGG